jgi:hypothetical protein
MNYLEPYKIDNIDLNKINYTQIRHNKNKKIIFIKYKENEKLVFQIPTLLNIKKADIFTDYSEIEVALIGKNYTKINNMKNFFTELELKIKKNANENAHLWFNDLNTENTINFQKIIRESEKYNTGTIKIKLMKTIDFETLILYNNKKITPIQIPSDSWCKMILECYAIWINSNNDFGIFLRPILVSFTSKEMLKYKYKFLDESDEENDFDVPDTDINSNILCISEKIHNSNIEINDQKTLIRDEYKNKVFIPTEPNNTNFDLHKNKKLSLDNNYNGTTQLEIHSLLQNLESDDQIDLDEQIELDSSSLASD